MSANRLGSAYRAYIGEVIRRSTGGARWERDHPVAGQKSYPLTWSGGVSFPMAWCYKRMVNEPEDNVCNKYPYLREHADKSKAYRTGS